MRSGGKARITRHITCWSGKTTQQHRNAHACRVQGGLGDDVVAHPGTAPNGPQQAQEACGRLNALIPCMAQDALAHFSIVMRWRDSVDGSLAKLQQAELDEEQRSNCLLGQRLARGPRRWVAHADTLHAGPIFFLLIALSSGRHRAGSHAV